jgi:hypothetical protein
VRYKEAEKECLNKIRNAKRNTEKNLTINLENNSKFARYINSKTTSRTSLGPTDEEGTYLAD